VEQRGAAANLLFPPCATKVGGVVVFKRPFFTSFTTSLWVRFLRFSLQSHKKLEDALAAVGLTPPQFYVLATIGYAGGLPFGEIGAKMMRIEDWGQIFTFDIQLSASSSSGLRMSRVKI
jgi:hypothetical protein